MVMRMTTARRRPPLSPTMLVVVVAFMVVVLVLLQLSTLRINVLDYYYSSQQPHVVHHSPTLPPPPPRSCTAVYVLPRKGDTHRSIGEHAHLVLDGIAKSPYLRLTEDPTESQLWIIDELRLEAACRNDMNDIQAAIVQRHQKHNDESSPSFSTMTTTTTTTSSTAGGEEEEHDRSEKDQSSSSWTLILNDWSDVPHKVAMCQQLLNLNDLYHDIDSSNNNNNNNSNHSNGGDSDHHNNLTMMTKNDDGVIRVRRAVRSTIRRGAIHTQFEALDNNNNSNSKTNLDEIRNQPNWRGRARMRDWYIDYNESSVVVPVVQEGEEYEDWRGKNSSASKSANGSPRVTHIPYHVRTDHVLTLKQVFQEEQRRRRRTDSHNNNNNNKTLSILAVTDDDYPSEKWNPNSVDRPIDVCHFWPLAWHDDDLKSYDSQLRDLVSHTLTQMQQQQQQEEEQSQTDINSMTFFVGVKGPLGKAGRTRPQYLYARQLVQCKIVVTPQRDFHEDHYRLMEALASGAMVLSDPMVRPPPGLIRGMHWDTFACRSELEDKIHYYIQTNPKQREQIALDGWRLTMSQYRSWHFMEKLAFGYIISIGMKEPTNTNISICF